MTCIKVLKIGYDICSDELCFILDKNFDTSKTNSTQEIKTMTRVNSKTNSKLPN